VTNIQNQELRNEEFGYLSIIQQNIGMLSSNKLVHTNKVHPIE
jgi:hypothetical protein